MTGHLRTWYVLHVKPRTEKKVAAYLSQYRFFCHLPIYVKVTKVQRRKVRRELPLFPGYVFTRLSPDERIKMLQTNLIVKTIVVDRPRETVHQLRQVSKAGRNATELRRLAQVFKAGDYVRIVSGPMRGTEGYVMRDGGRTTLCLNVEVLGAAAGIYISPEDVKKL